MKEYILLFLSTIFVDNLLFTKMLGIEFTMALRKEKSLSAKFWIVTVVLSIILSVAAQVLGGMGISPLVCGATFPIIGVICGFVFDLVTRNSDDKRRSRVFAIALSVNTAFLGIAFASISMESIVDSLIVGLSHGLGIILSAVMMMCIEEKIKYSAPPKFLGKMLLMLISVAVVSMAFSAFDGFALRYENIN